MKAISDDKNQKKRYKSYRKRIAKLESKVFHKPMKKGKKLKDVSQLLPINSLIKTTKLDPASVEKARGVLDNHLFLMDNLETIEFKDKINWNYQHTTSANTYSLYMQCINALSLLCDAFHETEDRLFLYKAYEILLDWLYFEKTDKGNNAFVWSDHTAPNRVLNIIYFYCTASEEIEVNDDILLELLVRHGQFLMDDQNYVENNHGIMMDRSLIVLSIFLFKHISSQQWLDKGKHRIKNAFYRDFSFKGVHLENSPGYHALIKNMYQEIIRFMKSQKLSLDPIVEAGIRRSNAYLGHIYRPNKKMPIIGDTQQSTKG
ncbi:MAG TPA: heparinase II/III family protein, partial [Bacillota bacterium]|nr:heparinase II/III family protein [Bacillota bacterium]